jgi:hypothetical protein
MKFNFKKITPIIAGALLLGSTIGFAAAADLNSYSSPFVSSGVADVAVIYGADAQTIDMASATLFTADLAKLATTTSTGAVASGENVKIESSSAHVNINDNLTAVRTTTITKSDLPTLLADKTYQSKDGVSYTYEQKIALGNSLQFNDFADTDYENRMPTLGVKVARSMKIMDYTLSFTKSVESDVDSSGRLEDIQDSDITILGKSYRILNAYNGTNLKLELMSGAVVDSLLENANKSYTMGGKAYDISVSNIATDGAALTVNGQTTPKMTAGSTYKLSDGTQVGIRTLWYQTNKVSSVEFSLGAEKLTLENGTNIKLNDVSNYDITGYIFKGTTAAKVTISSIVLTWTPDQAKFVTPTKDVTLPTLGSVKLTMGDPTFPAKEVIKLQNSGAKTMALSIPIKSGTASIDLLSGNNTAFTSLGGEGGASTGKQLVTANGTASNSISFDRDTDTAFVATYQSGTAAESYYLSVASIVKEDGVNYTTIKDLVANADAGNCVKKKSETCTIGSVTLTFASADADNKNVSITAGSNTFFDRIISEKGLLIYLPVNGTETVATGPGLLNATGAKATWKMYAVEEDKNGNIANSWTYNITSQVGWTSDKAEVKSVDQTGLSGAQYYQIPGTSTTYVGYVASDLGSKITYDTAPTQDTLEIEYHGGESYANIFLSTAGATVSSTGGSAVFDVAVSDKEAIPNANLIVIGGSAVNRVSAQLLGLTYPAYGTAFTEKTGVSKDQAILKLVANPSYATKSALLVAGWEGKDTKTAAKALISKSVALSGKTEVVLGTVTETATLVSSK